MKLVKKIVRKLRGYPFITNAGCLGNDRFKPRALLVYITEPFTMDKDDPRILNHQNMRQCRQIVQVLGELGYIVDVAHAEDLRFKATLSYDLLIRQKVGSFPALESPLFAQTKKVYLATGMNPLFQNRNLKRRHEDYEARRGRTLPLEQIVSEKMGYVAEADAIFSFGNVFTAETWRRSFNIPLYMFNNYAYEFCSKQYATKNYVESRKNYLYFASGTQLLKGLDLLLEIFPRYPDIHLYVCGNYEKERSFCECYWKELFGTHNVHASGWINLGSPEYYRITESCAYTILTSCAEGQAGSVVQTMLAGLSPVITRECGIDTTDFGVTFQNDSLDEIEHTILELADLPAEEVQRRCELSHTIAEKYYSEQVFLSRWREMILQVMS